MKAEGSGPHGAKSALTQAIERELFFAQSFAWNELYVAYRAVKNTNMAVDIIADLFDPTLSHNIQHVLSFEIMSELSFWTKSDERDTLSKWHYWNHYCSKNHPFLDSSEVE